MGLLASELKIGDNILIIGAGPIGQILARWVLISGPKNVVVVDNTQFRLDLLNNNNIDTLKAILDKDSPYLKSIILNKGGKSGLQKGMPVLKDDYLIGRVVEVNYFSSRVLLINDLNRSLKYVK